MAKAVLTRKKKQQHGRMQQRQQRGGWKGHASGDKKRGGGGKKKNQLQNVQHQKTKKNFTGKMGGKSRSAAVTMSTGRAAAAGKGNVVYRHPKLRKEERGGMGHQHSRGKGFTRSNNNNSRRATPDFHDVVSNESDDEEEGEEEEEEEREEEEEEEEEEEREESKGGELIWREEEDVDEEEEEMYSSDEEGDASCMSCHPTGEEEEQFQQLLQRHLQAAGDASFLKYLETASPASMLLKQGTHDSTKRKGRSNSSSSYKEAAEREEEEEDTDTDNEEDEELPSEEEEEEEEEEGYKTGKATADNILTLGRFERICQAARLLPSNTAATASSTTAVTASSSTGATASSSTGATASSSTGVTASSSTGVTASSSTGATEDVGIPSMRSMQLLLAAFRSAVWETISFSFSTAGGGPIAAAAATASEKKSSLLEMRHSDNMKYKKQKKELQQQLLGKKKKKKDMHNMHYTTKEGKHIHREGSSNTPRCFFTVKEEELREIIILRLLRHLPTVFEALARNSNSSSNSNNNSSNSKNRESSNNSNNSNSNNNNNNSSSNSKNRESSSSVGIVNSEMEEKYISPHLYPGWRRLRLPLRWFVADVHKLLIGLQQQRGDETAGGKKLLLQVLLAVAQRPLLRWILLPFEGSRRLIATAVARCWAFTSLQQQQLAAFAVLRSAMMLLLQQQQEARKHVTSFHSNSNNKKGESSSNSRQNKYQRRKHKDQRKYKQQEYSNNIQQRLNETAEQEAISAEEKSQQLLQMLLRTYQQAAARNIGAGGTNRTWRSANRMQLLRNEFTEIMRVATEPTVVYRVAYKSIRELALTVRSVVVASSLQKQQNSSSRSSAGGGVGSSSSSTTPSSSSLNSSSTGKRKSKAGYSVAERRLATAEQLLFSWGFIETSRLWGASFHVLQDCLKPLAYPLISLLSVAVKLRIASTAYMPFCTNLLLLLEEIAEASNLLVPLAAYIALALELLLRQQRLLAVGSYSSSLPAAHHSTTAAAAAGRNSHKKRKWRQQQNKQQQQQPTLQLARVRPAAAAVTLKFSLAQQRSMQVLDATVVELQQLLTCHLAFLSLHPAFPEISLPVQRTLKHIIRSSRSHTARHSIKTLLAAVETSATAVQQLRLHMTDIPLGKVAIFTAAKEKNRIPLQLLRRQVEEEQRNFLAKHIKGEIEAAAERSNSKKIEAQLTPKQLKRRRQKERRREEQRALQTAGAADVKKTTAKRQDDDDEGDREADGMTASTEEESEREEEEEEGRPKKRAALTKRGADAEPEEEEEDFLEEISDLEEL